MNFYVCFDRHLFQSQSSVFTIERNEALKEKKIKVERWQENFTTLQVKSLTLQIYLICI